jgi:redox-sensitive bicupin YhaK (pirin superfamily)
MPIRPVRRLAKSKPTLEGAGVHLHRAFGFGNTSEFDPFLLLDDFRNDRPENYRSGFPWHPHRGIETITYVLAGTVEHGDSMGNRGTIGPGDVQWMTAGSGIIHQEMPQGDERGRMEGFQLWANLPAALKMTDPRYQGVSAPEIPVVGDPDGSAVRVVCGRYGEVRGPVEGVAADPTYLDVTVPARTSKTIEVAEGRNAFAYVFAGAGTFGDASPTADAGNRTLVAFGAGDRIAVQAGEDGCRFLLVSGVPLGEPVAWHGPIVMNTQDQLREAFEELEHGTFLKNEPRK